MSRLRFTDETIPKSQTQVSKLLSLVSLPDPNSDATALLINSEKCIPGPNLGCLACHWSHFCQGAEFSDKPLKAKGLWDRAHVGSRSQEKSVHLLIHSLMYMSDSYRAAQYVTAPGDAGIWR